MTDAKYSIAIEAVNKFTAPFRSYEKANNKLTAQLKGQQAELRNLKNAQRDLSGFDRLKRKAAEAELALSGAKLEQQELAAQMKAAENPSKRLSNAYEKAKLKTAQLSAEYQRQTNRLQSVEKRLESAGLDANKFAASQAKLERSTEKANAALTAQRARLKSLGDAQAKVQANRAARSELRGQVLETAAIGYIAAQPIRAAINYESSMADVKKVVDFDSDAEAQKMGRDILKMSTQIPIAADGIADIVSAAGQSGVAKDELLGFAGSAAKMATAFDISAADAGSTMASWRASMGLTQEEAVSLADATNHLSNNISATAGDISGVLKRQGAVAMAAGFSEIQAASLSAALLSGGASEEVSATALKNITGALTKGDSVTSRQAAAFEKLGFDPAQLSSDMIGNAPDTLIRVFEAMQEVPEDEVSALVSNLFGEEVKGSVMPLLKNMDNLKKAFNLTSDAAKFRGSMEAEYQARSATTANNLQLLSNKFSRLAVSVGTLLLPALNDLLGPVAAGADILATMAEESPRVARGISLAVGGLVAFKVGALAVKMAGLTIGQGINMLGLGRAKLAATTASTATSANLATAALARMNAMMRATAAGGIGGVAMGAAGSDVKGGKVARGGKMAALKSLGGKLFKPLNIAMMAPLAMSAVAAGDAKETGAVTGNIAGGMGGAMAGAAAGAALGSVVPIVGTVAGGIVGSIVGGMGGSIGGEWLGSEIGSWFTDEDKIKDRLPSPESVQKQIASQDNRSVVFKPTISIPPSSGNLEADKRMVDMVLQRLKNDFAGVMGSNELGVRLDGSLSDVGGA